MSACGCCFRLLCAALILALLCFLVWPALALDLPQGPGAAKKKLPTAGSDAPAAPASKPESEPGGEAVSPGAPSRRSAVQRRYGGETGSSLVSLPAQPIPEDRSPQAEYAAVKALLEQFLAPGADPLLLTRRLRPASGDYAVFFGQMAAGQAKDWYEPFWELNQILIRPRSKQSEVLVYQALTDELRVHGSASRFFPPGWRDAAHRLRPGRLVYAFKFVQPDGSKGVAYDGLTCINGRFVFFPKPWKALGR